jgi:endo-1,4-beta-xylanase
MEVFRMPIDLIRDGNWHCHAGVHPDTSRLVIEPTDLSIVNKRENNRLVPNPAINVYGTRLQASGGFTLDAHIVTAHHFALRLYGKLPSVFDDFRYEYAYVECKLGSGKLSVAVCHEAGMPERYEFTIGNTAEYEFKIRYEPESMHFTVNDNAIGSVPAVGLFATGSVWLGLDADISAEITKLEAGSGAVLVDTTSLRVVPTQKSGLEAMIRKPGFHLGAAMSLGPTVGDSEYAALFLGGEVGRVTLENALKPQNTQPIQDSFTFEEAEALVEIARQHHLAIHGHTLFYAKAMPMWMRSIGSNKEQLREVLEKHVATIVTRFKGRIASWDVVNEVIEGFGHDTRLEENAWQQALGEEYIDLAFKTAHAADPDARLFINDYGLETNDERARVMFALLERLIKRGVPVHGLGIQGHVYEMPRDTIRTEKLRSLMERARALGLEVRVSELDVTGAQGEDTQAAQYEEVLKACLEAPNCTGLTIWGLTDKYGSTAWLQNGRLRYGSSLPYDENYRPKLARATMKRLLTAGQQ